MEIIISSNTSKPIYEQITEQVKNQVMSGKLKQGQPIPSMRALARTLHISVITVQKAYEELQKSGFVETVVGKGSFISDRGQQFYQEEQQRIIEEHLELAVSAARRSGINLEKLTELLGMFYKEGE